MTGIYDFTKKPFTRLTTSATNTFLDWRVYHPIIRLGKHTVWYYKSYFFMLRASLIRLSTWRNDSSKGMDLWTIILIRFGHWMVSGIHLQLFSSLKGYHFPPSPLHFISISYLTWYHNNLWNVCFIQYDFLIIRIVSCSLQHLTYSYTYLTMHYWAHH